MPPRVRIFRVFATLAAFAVAWLVASPARAGAPVCDPRGAITFAPPPQIQDLEQSLDVVDPCDGRAEDTRDARHVTRGHRGGIFDFSSAQEHATESAVVVPIAAPLARVRAPGTALLRAPPGVRSDVERPPRS